MKSEQLTSLAALDSTRLQQALALEFGVQQDKVTGAHTYGGHGEQMAVFASQVKVDGKPLSEMGLSAERWEEIKHHTVQGGSNIIKLRGRSSFQSPAYNAVKMIEAAMGGEKFTLPAGCYVNNDKLGFKNVMMAMPTTIDKAAFTSLNQQEQKKKWQLSTSRTSTFARCATKSLSSASFLGS